MRTVAKREFGVGIVADDGNEVDGDAEPRQRIGVIPTDATANLSNRSLVSAAV